MKAHCIYALLLAVKALSRTFYHYEIDWVGRRPRDPWANLRLVLILNHTSLYEPLFAGWVPKRFLKHVAYRGLVPIADKTINRPMVGRFFSMVARNVIPITRLRDGTWDRFIGHLHPEALVLMLPEGRMRRSNGMDLDGNPMTVRGGVADILQQLPQGRMLIAYSGGLHHVQIPKQFIPKLFKTLRMKVESLDIDCYRRMLLKRSGPLNFKGAVVQDLEDRLANHCPL